MKVKQFVLLALVSIDTLLMAQEFPLGIRAQALGGGAVACGREAESLFDNPALLADFPGSTLTIFYTNPFGIKELRLSSFSASTRYARFAAGAAFVDFGQPLYRDQRYHLAMARSFLPAQRLVLGVSGTMRRLRISGYGDDSALLLNFGTQLRLSESLRLGSALTNLLDATIGQQQERLPRSAALGLAYSPTTNLTLQMEVYQQNDFSEEWRLGLEVNPVSPLLLRFGVGTDPDRLTGGFALRVFKVSLQFAAFSHTDLGWTEQFAVTLMSR
ncbi:MAG: hypothetical protein ALAOOOJD_00696 [bacterium]|nr:hypothetical protein [bacterium]